MGEQVQGALLDQVKLLCDITAVASASSLAALPCTGLSTTESTTGMWSALTCLPIWIP
jgi:hypothetical protein